MSLVLLHEGGLGNALTSQSNGVNVFPVIAEGHVLLAETYGVLALGDTIKDLEFFLGDALGIVKDMSCSEGHAFNTMLELTRLGNHISMPNMPTLAGRVVEVVGMETEAIVRLLRVMLVESVINRRGTDVGEKFWVCLYRLELNQNSDFHIQSFVVSFDCISDDLGFTRDHITIFRDTIKLLLH